MLRWVLAILLGWWIFRIFRRIAAPAPPSPRGPRERQRPLDPGSAVEASWTEVDEEGPEI